MQKLRDPVEIGKILRDLRGIRVRTGVAKELGISYSMLCKIEDGIRIPSDDLKEKIACYYEKTPDEIFFEPKYHETT